MHATVKPRSVILASNNRHKVEEFQQILGSRIPLSSLADLSEAITWNETGETFEENVRIKAHAVFGRTGGPVLADDSGLVVPALGGKPGVYSSSYGGVEGDHRANTERLLKDLLGVGEEDRKASFVCCLLFLDASGQETMFWGQCDGTITTYPRGNGGFGYDPVFVPAGHQKTFAELGPDIKNSLSHRNAAARKLAAHLATEFHPGI